METNQTNQPTEDKTMTEEERITEKLELKKEIRGLRSQVGRLKSDFQRIKWQNEKLELEIDEARQIKEDFEKALNLQIALKTKKISEDYIEFITVIKDLLKEIYKGIKK